MKSLFLKYYTSKEAASAASSSSTPGVKTAGLDNTVTNNTVDDKFTNAINANAKASKAANQLRPMDVNKDSSVAMLGRPQRLGEQDIRAQNTTTAQKQNEWMAWADTRIRQNRANAYNANLSQYKRDLDQNKKDLISARDAWTKQKQQHDAAIATRKMNQGEAAKAPQPSQGEQFINKHTPKGMPNPVGFLNSIGVRQGSATTPAPAPAPVS